MALVQQSRRMGIRPVPVRARRAKPAQSKLLNGAAPLFTLALIALVWELAARSGRYRAFILPGPGAVFRRWLEAISDGTTPFNGTIMGNLLTTMQEAGLGFLLAVLFALPLGYLLAHVPLAERFFSPLIAASQAVPAVAVAPLLLLWLGNGMAPKVAVCAAIVSFPLLVNTMTGVRGVPVEYLEVARVFGAPWWEQVVRVELPLAAPVLLGGAKLGLALALTGAVVGEFLGADSGLGFLLTYTLNNYDTPLLFATLLTLGGIGIALYSFVTMLERIVSRWQG